MKSFTALLLFFASIFPACASEDPPVVGSVDLPRYAGLWYEIGHSPNFFQGGCESSTAEYGLKSDGTLSVLNTCYSGGRPVSSISGTATIPDPREPAKLKVDFGFFRRGDYWIIDLDPEYRWAVVSGPGKSSLFILARQAPMPAPLLQRILAKLKAQGFETDRIIFDKY